MEFQVVDRSDEIEAKAKTFTSISIAFAEDTKDFQFADDILDQNAKLGKCSIAGFLVWVQRMELRFLGRCLTVDMQVRQALIARICQSARLACNRCAALFE